MNYDPGPGLNAAGALLRVAGGTASLLTLPQKPEFPTNEQQDYKSEDFASSL